MKCIKKTIAAYCSMDRGLSDQSPNDYERLLECFSTLETEADFYAEDIHPKEPHRAMWESLLEKMKTSDYSELIFPSALHLPACAEERTKFLSLVRSHGVRVRFLDEEAIKAQRKERASGA